jgi:hypothetical protein
VKRECLGVASDGRDVCLSFLLKSLAVLCENRSLQRGDECDLIANKTLLSSNSIAAKESPLNFISKLVFPSILSMIVVFIVRYEFSRLGIPLTRNQKGRVRRRYVFLWTRAGVRRHVFILP